MSLNLQNIELWKICRKLMGLTVGAMIYSAGLNLFLIPNHVIDGGVTGISLLVQELTGVPFSVLIILLNLPFFYVGWRLRPPMPLWCCLFALPILKP